MTDYSIDRDRWGRPLLHPLSGGAATPYTRVSTMAKWLDSQAGLLNWKASMAMIGMARSKPIQARISAIMARSINDPYRENKDALKELVENATQIAQAQGRADLGTAVHEFTELLDSGTLDWEFVPEQLKAPLDAYRETMSGFEVVDTEVFVAIDFDRGGGKEIRGAGSLDRIIRHPELGVCVADIKTGAEEPNYPLGVTTQVAAYSHGRRYRDSRFAGSPKFDDGEPNEDSTAYRKDLHPDLNKSVGLMIHLPLEVRDPLTGRGHCALYELDLDMGWDSLLLGQQVQDARRRRKLKRIA